MTPHKYQQRYTKGNWFIRSGRFKLGQIKKVDDGYLWQSFKGTKDGGITSSFGKAKYLITQNAGISPRQYEISVEPTHQAFKRYI